MRLRSASIACLAVLGVIAIGSSAFAHGDLRRADPKAGVHLRKPPRAIELEFVEPPTADSNFKVSDGCREDVLAGVSGEGPNARLQLDGGAPGAWQVSYRVVSSVDGHLVRGSYRFHVGNKKPCKPKPSDEVGEAAPPVDNDSGGFPVVPVVIGLGIVGAAVVIRVFMTR